MDNNETKIWLYGAIVLVLCAAMVAKCGMVSSDNFAARQKSCLESGGSFIPTGDSNAACIVQARP